MTSAFVLNSDAFDGICVSHCLRCVDDVPTPPPRWRLAPRTMPPTWRGRCRPEGLSTCCGWPAPVVVEGCYLTHPLSADVDVEHWKGCGCQLVAVELSVVTGCC